MTQQQPNYTEAEWLGQLANHDENAFAHLFHAYRNKLYSFILHLSGSSALAEDILQEVFLKIWRDRTRLTGIDNFNAYLFRMAQNQAINVLRRQSREAQILAEIKRISAEGVHGDDILSAKEVQTLLHKALNNLPPQQRRVYELGRDQGLKYESIAAEMNISVSTVRNHMVQALKSIREYLQNAYPSSILYALPLLAALR
jgi:RNA polymerase sigma-70 factor (ECF subfamily)